MQPFWTQPLLVNYGRPLRRPCAQVPATSSWSCDPLRLLRLEDDWNPHSETLEAGCAITPETLLHEAQCRHVEARSQQPPTFADLPQLFDFERVLRANRLGRATGYDPFPSALFH